MRPGLAGVFLASVLALGCASAPAPARPFTQLPIARSAAGLSDAEKLNLYEKFKITVTAGLVFGSRGAIAKPSSLKKYYLDMGDSEAAQALGMAEGGPDAAAEADLILSASIFNGNLSKSLGLPQDKALPKAGRQSGKLEAYDFFRFCGDVAGCLAR